jgi:hypothetical protein
MIIERIKHQLRQALQKTSQPDIFLAAVAGLAASIITHLLRAIVEAIFFGN